MDDVTNEQYDDVSSNPLADEHLPVGGEIIEPDSQISADVLEDLNGEHTTDEDEETETGS
jgi:hypothetical protein